MRALPQIFHTKYLAIVFYILGHITGINQDILHLNLWI